VKLFSHEKRACAQFLGKKIMYLFFGEVQETTEWTLRDFMNIKRSQNIDRARVVINLSRSKKCFCNQFIILLQKFTVTIMAICTNFLFHFFNCNSWWSQVWTAVYLNCPAKLFDFSSCRKSDN
jgi:hypothetical protein